MQLLNKKPESLLDVKMHYCPGCGHGIIHRLVAEVMDELGIQKRTIGVAPVGCAVFADTYFNCDMIQGPHGRGPAEATGIKRSKPGAIVFSYQGDGDLASIGMAEIVHAAIRSENITVIFVNNAIYGMTGGQMAPTTMPNQVTTTTPKGRDVALVGMPMPVSEVLSQLRTPAYIERVSVHTPLQTVNAKRAIKKAFRLQMEGRCYSFVEVLSTCPTNWGKTAGDACKWVGDVMVPYYTLGVKKEP